MEGTLRYVEGKWYVDHSYSLSSEPTLVTVRWPVTGMRRTGSAAFAPDAVDGLAVTHVCDSDRFEAYQSGGYLVIDTAHDGSILKSPIPCPKVRRGIEVVYRNGAWQKCLRSGWTAA